MTKITSKIKYTSELCDEMVKYFAEYDGVGVPSFGKFAGLRGMSLKRLAGFCRHKKFALAWRECAEMRRDFLIDRALERRFDPSFVKFLLSKEWEDEVVEDSSEFTLRVEVAE